MAEQDQKADTTANNLVRRISRVVQPDNVPTSSAVDSYILDQLNLDKNGLRRRISR